MWAAVRIWKGLSRRLFAGAVAVTVACALVAVPSGRLTTTSSGTPSAPVESSGTSSASVEWPDGDVLVRFGVDATWVVTDGRSRRWASDAGYECLLSQGMRKVTVPWEQLEALPDGPGGEYICVPPVEWPAGDVLVRFGPEATWVVTDGRSRRWASDAGYACLLDKGMPEITAPWEQLQALPDGPGGEYTCWVGWPDGDVLVRFGPKATWVVTNGLSKRWASDAGYKCLLDKGMPKFTVPWKQLQALPDGPGGEYACVPPVDWPAGDVLVRFGPKATWVVTDGRSRRWASDAGYACLLDKGMPEMTAPWEQLQALPDGPGGEYACVPPIEWPAGDVLVRFGPKATWVVTNGLSKRWASDAGYKCLLNQGMPKITVPWEQLHALPDGPGGEYACVPPVDWPAGDVLVRFGVDATWVVTDGRSRRWASDAGYACLLDKGMPEITVPWEQLHALPDGPGGEYTCSPPPITTTTATIDMPSGTEAGATSIEQPPGD